MFQAGEVTIERVRTAQAGPVAGLIAQALLLAVLAGTVGLGVAGWTVGLICAVITNLALLRALVRYDCDRLGLADWVTLTRGSLAVGVAALVADSFDRPAQVTLLVTLTVVALTLDAVDGWIVRHTGRATPLGRHFDGEVDAFLIAVLSVYVASSAGVWVLAIGAARYAFYAAGWVLPWMRAPLPRRDWRRVVAAIQGIVLAVAAAGVLPLALTQAVLLAALALLYASFGHDVVWLWVHRSATPGREARIADREVARAVAARDAQPRGRVREGLAVLLTILALLVVWVALVAPNQLGRLTPGAFVRLPLEGLVVIALALVLPPRGRRFLACVVGPVLGLLVIVKVLDMGFFEAFDRPFDPVADGSYTGIGIETLRDSIGRTQANLLVAGAALLSIALLVLTTLAVLRLTRVAAGHRREALPAVTALGVVWVLCWAFGASLVSYAPIASSSAAGLAAHELRAVRAGVEDHAVFADQIRHDRFRHTPAAQLLSGLRGKDVLLVFVESYGKVAIQDSVVLARGHLDSQQGHQATAGRRLLLSQRLPHLADVRRAQLACAFHHAVGHLGQQSTALRPARRERPPDTQRRVQTGRVANGRRRAVEQPHLAAGDVVLPLRPALRPAQRRLSRPDVLLRIHARPVRLCRPATPRARQVPPASRLRGGRPGVEPHAVDPHPPDDRLERRRRRLDLQRACRWTTS